MCSVSHQPVMMYGELNDVQYSASFLWSSELDEDELSQNIRYICRKSVPETNRKRSWVDLE